MAVGQACEVYVLQVTRSFSLTAARAHLGELVARARHGHRPTVVVQERAIRALARIRSEDRETFIRIRPALPALADQPRPDEAVPWGTSGIYRWHLGGIRILYEVEDPTSTMYVINVSSGP
jgi:mRNA-degrading endonuclease RelE of RelBE toxin-antitoxin system